MICRWKRKKRKEKKKKKSPILFLTRLEHSVCRLVPLNKLQIKDVRLTFAKIHSLFLLEERDKQWENRRSALEMIVREMRLTERYGEREKREKANWSSREANKSRYKVRTRWL